MVHPFIIIPARMASGRFLGKPLAIAAGKTLLEWTYLQAVKVYNSTVVVATSDEEICRLCTQLEIPFYRTVGEPTTGSARCLDAFRHSPIHLKRDDTVLIDWQVDEPLVRPEWVEELSANTGPWDIRTLVSKIVGDETADPNLVKTVVSRGNCLWFSRSPMAGAYGHVGVYAFGRYQVKDMFQYPATSEYADAENLEQLMWIEQGSKVRANLVDDVPLSIDTPKDFELFRKIKEQET